MNILSLQQELNLLHSRYWLEHPTTERWKTHESFICYLFVYLFHNFIIIIIIIIITEFIHHTMQVSKY